MTLIKRSLGYLYGTDEEHIPATGLTVGHGPPTDETEGVLYIDLDTKIIYSNEERNE